MQYKLPEAEAVNRLNEILRGFAVERALIAFGILDRAKIIKIQELDRRYQARIEKGIAAGRSWTKSDKMENEISRELKECLGGSTKLLLFDLKAAFFKRRLANTVKKIGKKRLKIDLQ